MTLAHKFRDWLASLLPPGYNRSEEKRNFYGTTVMGLFYSIRNFSVDYRDAYRLLCDPEIVTRGFVYVKESEQLLQELRELAQDAVSGRSARRRKDDGEVCKTVRSAVSSYLYKHTKRSPMIIPMVTRL